MAKRRDIRITTRPKMQRAAAIGVAVTGSGACATEMIPMVAAESRNGVPPGLKEKVEIGNTGKHNLAAWRAKVCQKVLV